MTLLLKHIEETTTGIQKEALEAIDQTVKTAVEKIMNTIDSIKTQAKALDIFLPMNLIDTIARGGFIESHDIRTEMPRSRFRLEIEDRDILYSTKRPAVLLNKGRYRVTVIVERLTE